MDVSQAQRVGPYRLLRVIGEGGMGVVHLGLDPAERAVAVKVVRPHVAADPETRARLAREVRSLLKVRHPRVAEVLDADFEADLPYVVMRYVPGEALDTVVRRDGPLTGDALAELATGLYEAVQAIHSVGVVHRDLKPGNVLLLDGSPVVIDFGIARALDDVSLTSTGLMVGTPGYLSPEVLDGTDVGTEADWWGWGAVVAYAATGRPPFRSGPLEAVWDRVRRGAVDLEGLDERWARVLAATLRPDPATRPSPKQLADGIAALTGRRPATSASPVVPGAVAAAAAAAAGGSGASGVSGAVGAAGVAGAAAAAAGGADGTRVLPTSPAPDATRVLPTSQATDATRVQAQPASPAAAVVAGGTAGQARPAASAPPRREPVRREPVRREAAEATTRVVDRPPPPAPVDATRVQPTLPASARYSGEAPTQPQPTRPQPAQPYPTQPYPSQPHQDRSHPRQAHPGQPYAGQPYPGQPHAGQPYGQVAPATPATVAPGPRPADGPAPVQPRAGYGPAPVPSLPRRHGLSALAWLVVVAVAAVTPAGGAVLGLVWTTLARSAQWSRVAAAMSRARSGRLGAGARTGLVLMYPLRLVGALLSSVGYLALSVLVVSPLLLIGAALLLGDLPWSDLAVVRGVLLDPPVLTAAVALGALLVWFGPGGRAVREGSRALTEPVTRTRNGRLVLVGLGALVVVAAGLVVLAGL